MSEIKVNEIIEVTDAQYHKAMEFFSGLIFHKKKDGKYLIKIATGKHLPYIREALGL